MTEAIRVGEKLVKVELVANVAMKDDCRAHTGVVWNGKGDVQDYPERLWPKLQPHGDVWQLVLSDEQRAEKQLKDDLARQEAENANLQAQIDAERLARERDEAAGTNTDLVQVLEVTDQTVYTREMLDAMSDTEIRAIEGRRGYLLHVRLNPQNLRLKFLEAQGDQPFTPVVRDEVNIVRATPAAPEA